MRKKSVERRGDLCFTADCLDEVVDQHGYDLLAARAAYKESTMQDEHKKGDYCGWQKGKEKLLWIYCQPRSSTGSI